MEKILVEDIVPIIVIMALGYIFGKTHYFDDDQRQGLNKVVLNVALPAALFVSIVKASREMLASDLVLTILSLIGVTGMFLLSFIICKAVFHHTTQEAAVCALIAGSPTIGFLGFAVLDPIYGNTVDTNLVIGIVSIVVNAITIPIGMTLINVGQAKLAKHAALAAANGGAHPTGDAKAAAGAAREQAVGAAVAKDAAAAAGAGATDTAPSSHKSKAGEAVHDAVGDVKAEAHKIHDHAMAFTAAEEKKHPHMEVFAATAERVGSKLGHTVKSGAGAAFINAMKQPVCWSPVLAIVLVLLGIKIPSAVDPTFELIAKANSGIAVLVAGMALSTVKFSLGVETIWNSAFRLIITPAVILVLALVCGMGADVSKLGMLVMSVALPPAFSGVIIASRYNIYVKEGMSTTAVSTVGFAATVILWAWLVPLVGHMF
jgi:predicted permease